MGYVHHTVGNNENGFPQVDLCHCQVLAGSDTVVTMTAYTPSHHNATTYCRDTTTVHYELIFSLIAEENLFIFLMTIRNHSAQMQSTVMRVKGLSFSFILLKYLS